jgi:hypothetical protein
MSLELVRGAESYQHKDLEEANEDRKQYNLHRFDNLSDEDDEFENSLEASDDSNAFIEYRFDVSLW